MSHSPWHSWVQLCCWPFCYHCCSYKLSFLPHILPVLGAAHVVVLSFRSIASALLCGEANRDCCEMTALLQSNHMNFQRRSVGHSVRCDTKVFFQRLFQKMLSLFFLFHLKVGNAPLCPAGWGSKEPQKTLRLTSNHFLSFLYVRLGGFWKEFPNTTKYQHETKWILQTICLRGWNDRNELSGFLENIKPITLVLKLKVKKRLEIIYILETLQTIETMCFE